MQIFERNFQLKSRKAMQDLTLERNLKKTSWSVLDIYFIYFDKLQQKLFYNCKIQEKYGLFLKKNISVLSVWRPTGYWTIDL